MNKATLKVSRVKGMLNPVILRNNPVPTKTKICIYLMYIRSVLTYGGPAWSSNISNTNWKNIEVVQNISLRTILDAPAYVKNKILLTTTGLPTIREFIKHNTNKIFYVNNFSSYHHICLIGRSDQPILNKKKLRPINWAEQ